MNAIINRNLTTAEQRTELVQAGAWQVYRIKLSYTPKLEQEPICYLAADITEDEIRSKIADRPGVFCLVNAIDRVVALACAAQPHEMPCSVSGVD